VTVSFLNAKTKDETRFLEKFANKISYRLLGCG